MSKNYQPTTTADMKTILSSLEYSSGFLFLMLTSCVSKDMLTSSEVKEMQKYPAVFDIQKRYVSIRVFNNELQYTFLKDEGVLDRALQVTLRFFGLDVPDTTIIKEYLSMGVSFYDALLELFIESRDDYDITKSNVPFLKDGVEGVLGTLRSRVFVMCWLEGMCIGDIYGFSVPVFMATIGAGLFALLDIELRSISFSETFLKQLNDAAEKYLFEGVRTDTSFITDTLERILKGVER